jgi:anti-sigma regulatory factor (Ser/Thr protein kinase)
VASVYRLQERIAGMMVGGASIDRVEAEVIGPCELDEEHKAGLRLFATSLPGDPQPACSAGVLDREPRPTIPDAADPQTVGRTARRVDKALSRHAGAVPLAREAVDELAPALSPGLRDNTKLVVSELVTNAVRHGRGRVALSLALADDGRPTGEVADEGDPFEPPRVQPSKADGGGWGLSIVAALAERWGVSDGSSRIWFAMPPDRELAVRP